MGSNVLLEAKLAKKIDTYIYSSHKYGDFSELVQASNFYKIDN